jgi:hypothetical protein
MKTTKQKYATYGQLVDELAKFDQTDCACIIASTDLGSPDTGRNFVDGSGVKRVGVGDGVVTIVCGDTGTMTWGQVRTRLRDGITLAMADQPAIVHVGYDGLRDANGEPCAPRRVKECGVIEGDDTIWNIELGPAV